MTDRIGRVLREIIVFIFHVASKIMRQRPHLSGVEHLAQLPSPVIFSLTHDSYYEVPTLSMLYYRLNPLPDFLIIGKDDFLSGKYMATNFGTRSRILRAILTLVDKTGLPRAIFRTMRVTTIHRPFTETYQKKKSEIKQEITEQINAIKNSVTRGMSTVVFPEGTTWGFGGLKRIRSIVYQLVERTLTTLQKKVFIIPVNIKVDRLTTGAKDVFIRIGRPVFLQCTKDEFNRRLFNLMQRLHTITFSQVGALLVRRLAEIERDSRHRIEISRDSFIAGVEKIIGDILEWSNSHRFPEFDRRLLEPKYLKKKTVLFIRYCRSKGYLVTTKARSGIEVLQLNIEEILSMHPDRTYRKKNPLGFHANEMLSLGERTILRLCEGSLRHLLTAGS
ncbi:MAG: 1-acyl-sn-glycerol-3-phosphate acyltransferase [Spirochaetes bacterium]|nr:1-acyl-sn-glycerol-3-phosphate acyltransferase [Spirochaetota bacterium]